MPLLSCDANANGIIHQKSHATSSGCLSWPKKCNCAILTPLASCDASASTNVVTWTKKLCTSFGSSWPKECSGTIDDAVGIIASSNGITWPKSHIASQFECLDIRDAMVPGDTLLLVSGTPMPVPVASYDKKSCCTSFWISWP